METVHEIMLKIRENSNASTKGERKTLSLTVKLSVNTALIRQDNNNYGLIAPAEQPSLKVKP